MKKFRLYIVAALTSFMMLFSTLVVAAPANALFEGSKNQACNGANLQDNGGCSGASNTSTNVSNTLKTVLNLFSIVVGVVAVIMLIIGGIRFVTSQGEGSSTALARNTIIYALVGVVVAVMAQALVQFVVGRTADTTAPTSQTVPTSNTTINGCGVGGGNAC